MATVDNSTQIIISTESGTGWSVDVTNANLDPLLTLKDFIVRFDNVVQNNADFTKTSQTIITYNGVAIPSSTVTIQRDTPNERVKELTFGDRLQSPEYEAEFNRVHRLINENELSKEVRVTLADTTPGTLEEKTDAGADIALTVLNPGANEQLRISYTGNAVGDPHVDINSTGTSASAIGADAIAVGVDSVADGTDSIVVGNTAITDDTDFTTNNCIVIGSGATIDPTTPVTLTGTVDITSGLSTVVGTGTLFLTELAVGDTIRIDSQDRFVTVITDNLNLTVHTGWSSTQSGVTAEQYGADSNNNIAIGTNANVQDTSDAIVIGSDAVTRGLNDVVIGHDAFALTGGNSVVIGNAARQSSGAEGIAIGQAADAGQTAAVAIGESAGASGFRSMAFGDASAASTTDSIAFGANASATGGNSVAFGTDSTASQNNATAFGNDASCNGTSSVAIGFNSASNQFNQVVIGAAANAQQSSALAIGAAADSQGQGGIAIGQSAVSDGLNSIVLGRNSVIDNADFSTDTCIAIGNGATIDPTPITGAASDNSIAIGTNAIVLNAANAVQIGTGTNSTDSTLQFLGNTLADANGLVIVNQDITSGIDITVTPGTSNDRLFITPTANINLILLTAGAVNTTHFTFVNLDPGTFNIDVKIDLVGNPTILTLGGGITNISVGYTGTDYRFYG